MAKIKKNRSDYRESMLPRTRKGVFLDVLHLNWMDFLSHGLLLLLFSLPLHLLAVWEDVNQLNLAEQLGTLAGENQQALLYRLLSLSTTRSACDIFGFLILAVGMAGMIRVIRQYAWEENVYFPVDFPKGIRQNGKQLLALGLLVGMMNFLCVYCGNLAMVTPSKTMALILVIPICLLAVLGIPAAAYCLVAISLYENSFSGNLRLGLVMTLKAPWKTLLALLCCGAPYLVQLIPNLYCHVFGRLFSSLLTPCVMLGWYLFALEQFDRFVNQQKFPELVRRGLHPLHGNSPH